MGEVFFGVFWVALGSGLALFVFLASKVEGWPTRQWLWFVYCASIFVAVLIAVASSSGRDDPYVPLLVVFIAMLVAALWLAGALLMLFVAWSSKAPRR